MVHMNYNKVRAFLATTVLYMVFASRPTVPIITMSVHKGTISTQRLPRELGKEEDKNNNKDDRPNNKRSPAPSVHSPSVALSSLSPTMTITMQRPKNDVMVHPTISPSLHTTGPPSYIKEELLQLSKAPTKPWVGQVEVKFSILLKKPKDDDHQRRLEGNFNYDRTVPNMNHDQLMRYLSEIDIVAEHPQLVETVLECMLMVVCDNTDFVMLVEGSANDVYMDYCASESPNSIVLPFPETLTVLYADSKIPGVQLDRRVFVTDRIDYVLANDEDNTAKSTEVEKWKRWQEWTIIYPIVQFGSNFTVGNVEPLKNYVKSILDTHIQDGTFDVLLIERDDQIMASSSIEMELETFQEVLDTPSSLTSSSSSHFTKVMPPMRIAGVFMMIITIILTFIVMFLANRRQRRKEWEMATRERVKGGLVTTEGVDLMLDIGRGAAVEMKEGQSSRNSRKPKTPVQVGDDTSISIGPVIVKPRRSYNHCDTKGKSIRQSSMPNTGRTSGGTRTNGSTSYYSRHVDVYDSSDEKESQLKKYLSGDPKIKLIRRSSTMNSAGTPVSTKKKGDTSDYATHGDDGSVTIGPVVVSSKFDRLMN